MRLHRFCLLLRSEGNTCLLGCCDRRHDFIQKFLMSSAGIQSIGRLNFNAFIVLNINLKGGGVMGVLTNQMRVDTLENFFTIPFRD